MLDLNAYERYKQFMRDYQAHYGFTTGVSPGQQHQILPVKTDRDTLRETYQFICKRGGTRFEGGALGVGCVGCSSWQAAEEFGLLYW